MEEFQSLNQFRTDGRKNDESREIVFQCGLNSFRNFNGSSRIIQGVSEVICFIDGPKEVQQKERKQKIQLDN